MQLLWIWGNWLRWHEMRKGGAQLGVWRDQCCNKQPSHEMKKGGVQLGVWRYQRCNKLQQRSHEWENSATNVLRNNATMKRRKKRRPIGCLERSMMSIAKKIDGRTDLTCTWKTT